SLTECACYYPNDPATYYVTDAVGQGTLYYKWQVSTSSALPASDEDWDTLSTKYVTLYSTATDKGDTIIFSAVGKVMAEGSNWIRALVHDDYTKTWRPTTDQPIKVCLEDKPVYSLAGNIVCARDAAGSAVPFAFTAEPSGIDGRNIKYAYKLPSEANFTDITNGKTVTLGGKTLAFAIASDNLSIPATSAIPFEADSMVIRMEVRSCYTPAPETNTDTTIYAVLRVDAPVQVTARAKDTIICKDASFNMETGYALLNKTIPGNQVKAEWYYVGEGKKDEKPYAGNADGVAVRAFENVSADDAGTWYVDLSTNYCPAVSDTITVAVKNAPSVVSVEAEEVCAGSEITLTATVEETASPATYT
ncbi:MAG: hypothetical protein K2M92_02520, partial [Bacteroidales bacterium]|nr:hypothetical protein [Bacteroidales bacterium]